MDSNPEFFRWMNFKSDENSDTEMEDEQRYELEVLDLELLFSFWIEETDAMDETLGSLRKAMTLVGGHSFSNEDWNDDVNGR